MHKKQAEKGIITKKELYELLEVPPEGSDIKNNFISPPTAHSNLHNYMFSMSFLEGILFNKDETFGSNMRLFHCNKKNNEKQLVQLGKNR